MAYEHRLEAFAQDDLDIVHHLDRLSLDGWDLVAGVAIDLPLPQIVGDTGPGRILTAGRRLIPAYGCIFRRPLPEKVPDPDPR